MAKSYRETFITVSLDLSEMEAKYLRSLCQNYFGAQEEESAQEAKHRKSIFTALDEALNPPVCKGEKQ